MSNLLAWKAQSTLQPNGCSQNQDKESVEVREGTSGRVVSTLPKVWAVAATGPSRREAPRPELAFYRKYTEAMLHRYLRMSMESGRVPSFLGRSLFRGNVTSYRVKSFEDVVIFCHDVERRLAQLTPLDQQLVKRIGLQQYTLEDTAGMLGLTVRIVLRRYGHVLDRLSVMFLEDQMLELQS